MKRAWQIVIAMVLVVLLIGAICIGVGIITGAEFDRIYSVLDNRFNITIYYQYITDELVPALEGAGLM